MQTHLANIDQSVVVVLDMQPNFLKAVIDSEQILQRSLFFLEISKLLNVPVLVTEQNPLKMGGVDPQLSEVMEEEYPLFAKMSFSCSGSEPFLQHLKKPNRKQVFLIGIETHICMNQTAQALTDLGYEVFVICDAISARTALAHQIGLSRIKQGGSILTHSESVAYEWMESAEHPDFREVLELVKKYTVEEDSLLYAMAAQEAGPLGIYWNTPPL